MPLMPAFQRLFRDYSIACMFFVRSPCFYTVCRIVFAVRYTVCAAQYILHSMRDKQSDDKTAQQAANAEQVEGNFMSEERLEKLRLELRRGVLVLAVLAACRQPQYGYSLRKHLTDAGIAIDEGTLYPLVRRLAEQGLLDSEWQQAEGRERRYYELSASGRTVLHQLTEEWQLLHGSLAVMLEDL